LTRWGNARTFPKGGEKKAGEKTLQKNHESSFGQMKKRGPMWKWTFKGGRGGPAWGFLPAQVLRKKLGHPQKQR